MLQWLHTALFWAQGQITNGSCVMINTQNGGGRAEEWALFNIFLFSGQVGIPNLGWGRRNEGERGAGGWLRVDGRGPLMCVYLLSGESAHPHLPHHRVVRSK